ncbi:MAG: hypothetical protein ABI672_01805 [Vicinamibacteria bacterium]
MARALRLTTNRRALAFHWLVLAIATLGCSGVLAMGVAAARVPILARHLTNTDFARRVLVVHVDLGVVAWFCALPVALFHFYRIEADRTASASWSAAVAPWLSSLGALLLLVGLVPGLGTVYLVNYIPLVVHPLYLAGLALFLLGLGLSYLDRGLLRGSFGAPTLPAKDEASRALPRLMAQTLAASGHLVDLGATYVLLALFALGSGILRIPGDLEDAPRIEMLMWGPGHIFQFANVAFLMVAWLLLAAWGSGRRPDAGLGAVSTLLAIPLLPVLFLLVAGPSWEGSQAGFTWLMQWALFPALLLFLALVLAPHFRGTHDGGEASSRAVLWPLSASVALMLVGFVYGGLIGGSDLRIPGHYHASIGAVTLSYMALSLLLLQDHESGVIADPRMLRAMALLYGVGQFTFATGLMLAGSYGLGRKIFGVDQRVDQFWQAMGLRVMAVGGLLAFLGGAVWAWAAVRRLRAIASA